MHYNPWPIGRIPEHLQRPEIKQLRDAGYVFDDPRDIIGIFEQKVATFAGSKYAVAVDCCTHAIELSLRYLLKIGEIKYGATITIPNHTYVSIPLLIHQLGFCFEFVESKWSGSYRLAGTRVVDAAVKWEPGMFVFPNLLECLSFQIKKRIPIGRGGMVLTGDEDAANWIRLASYDGRDLTTPYDSPGHVRMPGWHYYMIPEDAARGILLMDAIKETGDSGSWENYPDCSQMLEHTSSM